MLAVVAAVVGALVVVSVLTPSPDAARPSAARAGGSDAASDGPRAPGGRPDAGAGRPDADPSAGASADPGASASGGTPRPRPASGADGRSSPTARPGAAVGGGPPSAGATAPAPAPAPATAVGVGVATPGPSGVGQEVALGALRATVVSVEPVAVDARGPGEIAGPGAVVRLRVRNASSAPAGLAGLAVTASSPDGVPAVPSGGEPAQPLAGALAPGEQRSGTYVFALPAGAPRGAPALRVEVGSDAAREVAVVLAS